MEYVAYQCVSRMYFRILERLGFRANGYEILNKEKVQLFLALMTQWFSCFSVRKSCSVSSRFTRTLLLADGRPSLRGMRLFIFILQQTSKCSSKNTGIILTRYWIAKRIWWKWKPRSRETLSKLDTFHSESRVIYQNSYSGTKSFNIITDWLSWGWWITESLATRC
jgi:hypothetical protein